MQFLFTPILGALSDRFGRRPVILRLLLRAGPRLLPDGAGAEPRAGSSSAASSRASPRRASPRRSPTSPTSRRRRSAPAAFGMVGAALRPGLHAGAGAGRRARAASTRACRSGSRAGSRSPTPPTATSCCPSRCRRRSAPRSRWKRANPVGSLRLLRSHRELYGIAAVLFLMQLSHVVLPRRDRALHGLPLRLGRDGGGPRRWPRWACAR